MASKRRPVSLSRWLGLGPEGKKRPRGSVVAMSEEDTDSDNVPLSRSMEIIKKRQVERKLFVTRSVDILSKIFAFLDPQSLLKVSRVCYFWRRLSKDNKLWVIPCLLRWPSTRSLPRATRRKLKQYYVRRMKALKCNSNEESSPRDRPTGISIVIDCSICVNNQVCRLSDVMEHISLADLSDTGSYRFAKTIDPPVTVCQVSPLDLYREPHHTAKCECFGIRNEDQRLTCLINSSKAAWSFGSQALWLTFYSHVRVRHGEYKRIAVRVHCEYQNGEDRHLGLLAKGIRFFMNNAAAPYLSTSDYSAAMASMPTECPFVVEEFAWH